MGRAEQGMEEEHSRMALSRRRHAPGFLYQSAVRCRGGCDSEIGLKKPDLCRSERRRVARRNVGDETSSAGRCLGGWEEDTALSSADYSKKRLSKSYSCLEGSQGQER